MGIQLEAIDAEDRDGSILGNAQKGTLQSPHGISLGADHMG